MSVLLLEAGGDDDVPSVLEANQWPMNIGSPRDWSFQGQPNPRVNGGSSEVQVCRKAKSPLGRRLDLPRATIYSSFKDISFMAKRIVRCHARFESSSEI